MASVINADDDLAIQGIQQFRIIEQREKYYTRTHYAIRYSILLYTLQFQFPNKFLKYVVSIIYGIIIFISIIITLFYFPLTGYISIYVCPNASNSNNFTNSAPLRFEYSDDLNIVFSAFFYLYFILGIYSFITILWYSNFLKKVCRPEFIYNKESSESGILEYNLQLLFIYCVAAVAALATSTLILVLSQQLKLFPNDYVMCPNLTLYQIALGVEYVYPFFIIGTVVWHLTPLIFSLSLYFILNLFHDKVFAAIDLAKQHILNHGRPNGDNAPMKSPLKAYYEVIDYINEVNGNASGLKLLLILNIIQVAVGLVILILNFESVIWKKNPLLVSWLIIVFLYHFVCVLLIVIKILYLNKTLHHFPDAILSDTDILESLMPLRPTPANKEFYLTMKEELQIISSSKERFEFFSIGDVSNGYFATLFAISFPLLFIFYFDQLF